MTAAAGIGGEDAARRSYLVGLIGEGVTVSLTPSMHEAAAARLGIDYRYRILDLLTLDRRPEELADLLAEAVALGYDAVNITHPCKQLAVDRADELDDHARRLGAVNLMLLRDGRMIGYNTDWVGYRDGLLTGLPGAALERVVQVGCGGAGSATAYALLTCGAAELQLSDVDPARADRLVGDLRELFPSARITSLPHAELASALSHANGVVHATPLGMAHHPGVAFAVSLLGDDTWVSDVVYRPLRTRLIRDAEQRGLRVLDGGRMAVGQAHAAFEIITGIRPDRAHMEQHFRALVGAEDDASGDGDG